MAPRRARNKRREAKRTQKKAASVTVPLARPLGDILRTQKPVSIAPETFEPAAPTDRALLGRLFADVTPLADEKRVSPAAPVTTDAPGLAERRRLAESESVRFVVDHSDERWSGYRATDDEGVLDAFRKRSWVPHRRLDLHGWTAAEVERDLDHVLRSARRRGFGRILLIHGRGTHSKTGRGVLGEIVVHALTRSPTATHVRAFQTAPPRLGGSGALCVELQPAKKRE